MSTSVRRSERPWSAAARTPTAGDRTAGDRTATDRNATDGTTVAAVPDVDAEFHRFYLDEADGIYRALALALGDADLAEEAAHEGLARAYQRWRKIGRYDSPAGWVYRVGLNWARSRLRKTGREVLTVDTAATADLTDRPGRRTGPAPEVDPDLRAALARLSIEARAVVVLRYLLEWSTIDTAEALGIAQGTVKSRLSRALAELETILEGR